MVHLQIATPDGVAYEDKQIDLITIPTESGVISIGRDHYPLVSIVTTGEILIQKGEYTVELAVSRGIVEIRRESTVYILADTAERAEDIDIERAEAARQKAEEYMKQKQNLADVEFARLQAKIEKELARIRVARRYRKR
ncbi:MAG: ATP synthase epsilon chain [candidate division WS6 bacterium OLB20]|uniref:ATP synthase epsilon chain n=1 Tax=candidate division WS6 bacterium OLB20 TaxID=1617426 RepID=A0A136M130_9BACT|nr:MAG: ATP synthase epsilon chain [candidate division WS6 bacterium OLB20]